MKTSYTAAIALALATLATSQTMAANIPADTRDTMDFRTGMTYRELFAGVDAAKSGVYNKTRDQVRGEAVVVQHSRDARDAKETFSGMSFREIATGVEAARSGVYSKTREQVRDEAVAAARNRDARDAKVSFTGMSAREMFGN